MRSRLMLVDDRTRAEREALAQIVLTGEQAETRPESSSETEGAGSFESLDAWTTRWQDYDGESIEY